MKSTEFTKKCPPATQDIGLNLKNRQKAINEYGYGPLNPNEPNIKFWAKKMDMWQLDGIDEAKKSLCGNCAAFDLTRHAINCIKKGIGSEAGDDPMDVIDAGDLGYCRFLKFKCAAKRTCDAWVVGGPLRDDKPVDESANLVPGNIAYHKKLNPNVWEGTKLRTDVRYKLLAIAKRFVEYLDIPNFKLSDVILRGSLVNYNYTVYSDFDLHIVTDFTALDCDITEAFYMAKKKIWNDEHDITIKGHEVELYIEDVDAVNVSEGTYSVLDSEWLRTPKYKEPEINDRAVNAKARDLMTQINRARKSNDAEQIQKLQDKIKNMRQAGLDAEGEFSTENLAFKIIRNKGYLDRLFKAKNQAIDQELSLDEDIKTNTLMAALVAALSGSPAQANYCNPETTQAHPNQSQNAITIMRGISNVKNLERAGMHIEAVGEAAKLFKNISKMPNKDCVAPIVKDQLPQLTDPSVNERKKAKKKKKSSKRRYPVGGYYGYYWGGGYNDNSGGDAGDSGGGGD
jgi:hypothetical protein